MKKLIMTLILGLAFTIPVFANGDDDTDRLSTNQSYTFSPGYLNAAKQKTEAILRQESPKKSLYDKVVEYVQSKLGKDMSEGTQDKQKITPNLQHRTGSTEEASQLISADGSISFGAADITYKPEGTLIESKTERTAANKIIAEWYLNNGKETRYVYVSKDTKYAIGDVYSGMIAAREGDVVFVKSGRYEADGFFIGKNNIKITGENANTTIFTISNKMAFSNSQDITLKNITFTGVSGSIGLTFNSCKNIVVENNIIKNTSRGLSIYDSVGSVISNNTLTGNGSGLFLSNVSNALTKNNMITGNSVYGVYVNRGGTNISLTENTIAYNWGQSIYVSSPTGSVTSFKGNYIYDNTFDNRPQGNLPLGTDNFSTPYKASTSSTKGTDYKLLSQGDKRLDTSALTGEFYDNKDNFYRKTLYGTDGSLDSKAVSSIFKGLLANENLLSQGAASPIDPAMLARLVRGSLNESALAIPAGDINTQEMRIAMALANILKNPTEDQKILIDAIKGLIQDMNNVEKEGEKGTSLELKKQTDNLIQMVANLLVAQAVPDLFKEGDIQGIKGIFMELDSSKTDIMRKYSLSTAPYYDKLKRDIEKNVNALQLNNIVSTTMSDEELKNMPRSDIDKIMEKLKKLDKRSFEADYILQQESKYRKEYLDPNKQKLEEDMKLLLQDVTKKLNTTLEAVPKKK